MNQEEIIRKCQQGDRQAFGLLYSTMREKLLAQCRHYVSQETEAEDLLHDSFLLIFMKIGQLKDIKKADAWMSTVVKNVALVYLQNQHTTTSLEAMPKEKEAIVPTPTPVTYEQLLKLVDSLPEGYRQVFRLSVLEGMSHEQIAALLNIKPHSSSSQLFRAKHILRLSLRTLVFLLIAALLPFAAYQLWFRNNEQQPVKSQSAQIEAEDVTGQEAEHIAEPIMTDTLTQPALPFRHSTIVIHNTSIQQQTAVRTDSIAATDMPATAQVTMPDATDTTETDPQQQTLPPDTREGYPTKDLYAEELPEISPSTLKRWTMDLAYEGLPQQNGLGLPYGNGLTNVADSAEHHHMPLTLSLQAGYRLSDKWSLVAGLHYSQMYSEFNTGNTYLHIDQEQRLRYMGLSLGFNYKLSGNRSWQLYGSLSGQYDWPLRSTLRTSYVMDNRVLESSEQRLTPSGQWSAKAGIGLQYNLTPMIGFFIEPSLRYSFQTDDDLKTWQTQHPLNLSVPLGLKITF